ncbi:unnamed protein product [Paramecium sonneborni]|uniref:Chorein N-terminal domain-containing protein n=1 Tax=Paramecium sonneborni TaxID=65129 RepID=A0A8S1R8K5_9CILI|nr:unnamed protein product [Paramecium sonneborni]
MQFLKSYFTDHINTYIFEYFDNISKDQITTQLSKGQIQLNNMEFKPFIFKKFNMPLIIKQSMINNISITFGKQCQIKIHTLNIVIEILNLYGNFIMESAIKLQILDNFKNSLVQTLLKAISNQDNQQKQTNKKYIFKLIQNMEIELTNFNIRIVDNYCTQNSFGIKLENLTCKSSSNSQQSKLRNIDIRNLQLFWQDPVTQINAQASLEDIAEQNSDTLSFILRVVFHKFMFNCSKLQSQSIYKFSDYISQFNKRQNQQVEKSTNNEDDEKVKAEIKKILTSIPLSEFSMESQSYDYLCQLAETQSINDLKQIQFEILKNYKGDEIVLMSKKNLGWLRGILKNDKNMEEKIVNKLDVLEQDPNLQKQYLKSLQLKFELAINQCQIGLSSIYRGQLNQLIINFQNLSMLIIKNNQLKLDFTIKQVEVLLQYQDKTNYLISKNTNFHDRYSLELYHTNDDKKESLLIQTCPFQILFNQEEFEKYYDLFYFFVVSENQIPKLTRKAKEQIQDIVNDQKEKDINFKFEKIYIISTNSKETFLFSPGSIDFNYNTLNSSQYQIKISDTTFGFSCIDLINQEYLFNSINFSRDFIEITKCDINLVIKVQDNQINSILELNDLNFQINPMIYKYFYQFFETHYQQPLKELKNQLRNNEENHHKFCFFHTSSINNKIKCRFAFQQNFLNLYEVEKDVKIMKIDLENIFYKTSLKNEFHILELKTKNQIIWLDFQTNEDRQIVINQCQISRDDNYYVENILQENGTNSIYFVDNIKKLEKYQEKLFFFEIKLKSIFIKVLENENQPLLNIHLTNLNVINQITKLQQNITLKFSYFTVTRDFNCQSFYFQDKNLLEIQNDQQSRNIIEYSQKLNEDSTVKLYLHYCVLSYRAKTIGQILEQYPIQIQKDWNLKKFIINFYLTQYPDLQIICNDMNIEINLKQILFKQSELKQIKWTQNYIQIMFPQDSFDEDCLQFKCIPQGILKVQNQKEMTIDIKLKEAQAIMTQLQTLQISKLKKRSSKKVLLSVCDIIFNWQLVIQTNVINHLMNFRMTQLKFILGAKDISYISKEIEKLSKQIADFYNSHDIAKYLIQQRAQIYQLNIGVQAQIQLVFIDDLYQQSQPMFGITLKQPILTLKLNQNDIDFQIKNILELYFYHSFKLEWEPVIESIYLQFILTISNQNPKIILSFQIQDVCNINISMELIQNLLKFQLLNQQFQYNQKKLDNQQINQNSAQIITYETYEICNFSGLQIVAEGKDQQIIKLSNLQKIHTTCKGLFQFDVNGINTTLKIQNWNLQLQKKKVISEKGITLIIETIVDEFMNSSKTIISSNMLIINLTPFPLQINISGQEIINLDQQDRFQQFQKFQKYPNIFFISSHQQKGKFCVQEKNISSEYFNYSDIALKLEQKNNSEILSLNNRFFRLQCVHDPLMKERSMISIVPFVEFINQTPFKIRIDKNCPEDKQFLNFTIAQNEIVQDCQLNPYKNNKFFFTVDRYYQSIEYTFQDLMKKNEICLEDEKWYLNYDKKNLNLILLIQPKVDDQGRQQIIISFKQSYLINNTKLDLVTYQGTEQNFQILGGQKYSTSYQLIVLLTIKKNHQLIFEERNSNLKTQPLILEKIIKIHTINIQKKENDQTYYIPILIMKNFIQMGDCTIPFFELGYKYLVLNRLAQKIQLCYKNTIILLEPFVQTPLQIWNLNLINDPNLPYECSLKINIDNQILETEKFNIMTYNQFIMLIRTIDLCLRKFLKVTILYQKGQYQFLIDEIENQQDYPYMIINESKSLQIKLERDNKILTNGGRFPLAQENQSDQEFTYLVNLKDQRMKWENSIQFALKLDQIGLSGTLKINGLQYNYVIIKVDQQKQFIFKDFQKLSQSQYQLEKIKYIFELRMQIYGCTISYLENLKYQCKELAICFLENIAIQYKSNELNQKQINFNLYKLQIDAQSKTLSEQKTILFSEVQEQQNSIEFDLRLDGARQDCIFVDLVNINLGNFQFCMDQRFKDKQEQIQAQLQEFISLYSTQKNNNQLLEKQNPKYLQKKIREMKQTQIFVRKLQFQPMKMKILYLKDIYEFQRQQFVEEYFRSSLSNIIHNVIIKYILFDQGFCCSMISQYVINKLMINPNKLIKWKKIRIKRAMYEPMKLFKVFNEKQAQHYEILKQAKKCDKNIKFSDLKFIIISMHNAILKNEAQILYICEQQIFFIHESLIQIYLKYDDIKLVYSKPESLQIHIVCQTEELTLLMEDQSNLEIAIQSLNRFQN